MSTQSSAQRRGMYIAVGAILGVGAGLLFGNLAACSVIGVGLGFAVGIWKTGKSA